ncbi:hypothetical protein PHYPO_G00184570 [Pangasianodon hypophthalmus]|uniref:Uncharacterized protein n=1 Tax=Pangasianodon hypophthalmus TaxID=310915 RepID=A0A5N5PR49_PANHP|nr:hypothetical protein PHYPO_G00184570 [Pangasianodon hypophthalmus]
MNRNVLQSLSHSHTPESVSAVSFTMDHHSPDMSNISQVVQDDVVPPVLASDPHPQTMRRRRSVKSDVSRSEDPELSAQKQQKHQEEPQMNIRQRRSLIIPLNFSSQVESKNIMGMYLQTSAVHPNPLTTAITTSV